MNSTTYGVGGYKPEHPSGNIVEQTLDHGDGTGTRTTYHPDGTVDSVEQLSGLPILEPFIPSQTPEQVAVEVIREEIDLRLSPSDVNSIAEVKAAIRDGLDAASQRLA